MGENKVMRPQHKARMAGWLALVGLISLMWFVYNWQGNQINSIAIDRFFPPPLGDATQTLVSPGGDWKATMYADTAEFVTGDRSVVVRVSRTTQPDAHRSVYYAVTWETSMRWLDENLLLVNGRQLDVRNQTYYNPF